MILVNYTTLEGLLPLSVERLFLQRLPIDKAQSLSKISDSKRRNASILGLALLEQAVRKLGIGDLGDLQLNFSPTRKPSCSTNIEFNITHSDTLVACAVSLEFPLGIDSETRNDNRSPQLKHVFNESELQEIAADARHFLNLWVKKEAVAKAVGCGITKMKHVQLNQDSALYQNQLWYLHPLELVDNDVSYLACKEQYPEIQVYYHSFADCVDYCAPNSTMNCCHG